MLGELNSLSSLFKGGTNPGDTHGIKIYLQATKEINIYIYNINVSVSKAKDVADHFHVLAKKYCCSCLVLRTMNLGGDKNILRQLGHVYFSYMNNQS